MQTDRTSRGWEQAAPSVMITIRWGASVLHVAHLSPPRSFSVGEAGADYLLPADALGAARAPIIVVDEAGTVSLAGEREVPLPIGAKATIVIGAFTFEIAVARAGRAVAGHYHVNKRILPFQIASTLLHLSLLGSLAFAARSDRLDPDEVSDAQIYEMQRALMAAADKEEIAIAQSEDDAKEGGTGTRARGEEGVTGGRYGVMGPSNQTGAQIARAAALRDAAEYGMIGLLSSGNGSDGSAAPWGANLQPQGQPQPMQAADPGRQRGVAAGAQEYADWGVNPPTDPAKDRLSTFAVDVDTGAYSMARRRLREGALPPPASVRAEEFLNSFDYGYEGPKSKELPFAVHLAAAPSPFASGHHLLRVAVQGRRVAADKRKPVHLVYLVDTSGSMQAPDRIELAKKSLKLLTGSLKQGDTVALCTYAGGVREVLRPTGVGERARILAAISDLTASGSTAMASGIDLAYQLAEQTQVPGEISRVIVLSDGDANVGPTSHEEILKQIRRYKEKGITLSTVGFGQGNYKDKMMEQLADQGDGNYSYIDSERQAERVFSQQVSGMLEVIARDVKIQVEWNPRVVQQYRLLGYENRDVADKDFRNDKVDGGEIGAGHSVTAFYDVTLRSTTSSPVTVRLRHKAPLGRDTAAESTFEMSPAAIAETFERAPADLRFGAAVAGFAEILRGSAYAEGWRIADVERVARGSAGAKEEQAELVELIVTARRLMEGAPLANR